MHRDVVMGCLVQLHNHQHNCRRRACMELPQCMCFLDRKKCVNLLASLHNKFTCVETDTDEAVKLQEEYIKQFRKHPSLGYTGTHAKAKLPAAKVAAQSFATPIFGKGKKDKMRYGLKKRVPTPGPSKNGANGPASVGSQGLVRENV